MSNSIPLGTIPPPPPLLDVPHLPTNDFVPFCIIIACAHTCSSFYLSLTVVIYHHFSPLWTIYMPWYIHLQTVHRPEERVLSSRT